MEQERKVDGRGMETVVKQPFSHIQSRCSGNRLYRSTVFCNRCRACPVVYKAVKYEFMLAYSFNRQLVAILEAFLDVVGREGCKFTCIQYMLLAQGQDVGVGPEDDSEIAHERAHSSGRFLPDMLNVEFPVFGLDYARARQAFFKPCRYSYRAASRTASSVRGRECLVKIQVHDVESHISRTNDSQQRVHVSSVIIQKASTCMY